MKEVDVQASIKMWNIIGLVVNNSYNFGAFSHVFRIFWNIKTKLIEEIPDGQVLE